MSNIHIPKKHPGRNRYFAAVTSSGKYEAGLPLLSCNTYWPQPKRASKKYLALIVKRDRGCCAHCNQKIEGCSHEHVYYIYPLREGIIYYGQNSDIPHYTLNLVTLCDGCRKEVMMPNGIDHEGVIIYQHGKTPPMLITDPKVVPKFVKIAKERYGIIAEDVKVTRIQD